MWFDMTRKHNKKSFKVVLITAESQEEVIIAKTFYYGYALEIAKQFDEIYTSKGTGNASFIIEVR